MRFELTKLLAGVDVPNSISDELRYYVKNIPNSSSNYFGRTSLGLPCLLLGTNDSDIRAPIRLATIEVSFSIPCNLNISSKRNSVGIFTVITCATPDRVIQEYFAEVCETILQFIGNSPSSQEIAEAVHRLIELFQKISKPSHRSIVGLFGELFVIHSAESPKFAVQAWRSNIDDRFDFSIDDIRLEVKSTGSRLRSHEFSLEQCTPPPHSSGILVSLFVEKSGGGMSINELAIGIREQLEGAPELLFKFQETLAEGLGAGAKIVLSSRFDMSVAKSSIQLYKLENIPAVRTVLPAEVSKVRFRSDLSNVPSMGISTVKSEYPQLAKLLPVY